jgi:hypothetical protein
MPRPRRETAAALQELYDQIPPIPDCQGHCWLSCGPTAMSDFERRRIRDLGIRITRHDEAMKRPETFWCEALGPDGRCLVYGSRPLVCRLWGAVEGLKCPYGCMPEGGWLSDRDGYRLLAEAMRLGDNGVSDLVTGPELMRRLATPGLVESMRAFQDASGAGDRLRFDEYGPVLPPEITSRRSKRVRSR